MSDIEVGKIAGNLTVYLVRGDIFTATFRNREDGVDVPWPVAPVLTLGNSVFPMILDEDSAVATVAVPAELVDAIIASGNKNCELNVGQITTWRGKYVVT